MSRSKRLKVDNQKDTVNLEEEEEEEEEEEAKESLTLAMLEEMTVVMDGVAGVPEDQCAICLCPIENVCVPSSCDHQFCFLCIMQWCNVNPNCPMCKQHINYLIHSIVSELEFKKEMLSDVQQQQQRMPNTARMTQRSLVYKRNLQLDASSLPHITDLEMMESRGKRALSMIARLRDNDDAGERETSSRKLQQMVEFVDRELQVLSNTKDARVQAARVMADLPALAHLGALIADQRQRDAFVRELLGFASSGLSVAGFDSCARYFPP